MTISQLSSDNRVTPKILLDFELIISHVIKRPREFILGHPEFRLSKIQAVRFKQLWQKRLKNYPLAYILGHKEFFGLDFTVNENVLIPRPETEFLVEKVIDYVKKSAKKKNIITDVGTGSGCIAIALKKSLPSSGIIGLDTSAKALITAQKNSWKNKTAIRFYRGQAGLLAKKKIFSDIIVANLPYLDKAKKQFYYRRCPELKYEPSAALFSARQGLTDYSDLLKTIIKLKKPPQAIFLEIGSRQIKAAESVFSGICGVKYDIDFNDYKGTAVIGLVLKK